MSEPLSQLRAHTDGIVAAPYKLFNPAADDNADAFSAVIWLKAMFLQWWKWGRGDGGQEALVALAVCGCIDPYSSTSDVTGAMAATGKAVKELLVKNSRWRPLVRLVKTSACNVCS